MTDAVNSLSPLEDRYLDVNETAHYISVAVATLSKWRLRGIGPRYSAALGRDPRYRLSDIIEFMNTKMAANTREAQTVRREAASVAGVRYTARRQTRPVSRRA